MDGKLPLATDDREVGELAAVKEPAMTVRFQVQYYEKQRSLLV